MRKLSKVNIVLLKEVFDEKLSNRFLDATKRNRLLTHKLALFGFLSLSTEIKWFNLIYIIVLVLIDNRFSNFKSKKKSSKRNVFDSAKKSSNHSIQSIVSNT